MTSTLFLLRHAHAEPGTGSDHERHLTHVGIKTAKAVGLAMLRRGQRPERVLVSSANRTRETALLVLEQFDDAPTIETRDDLYLASEERLRAAALEATSVMIVAHNPGIGDLARSLAGANSQVVAYPPGALTAFAFEGGLATLLGYWPRPD